MFIDSHAHVNFAAFSEDWEKVILDCQKNNIWLINVGAQFETSRRAVEISEKYEKGVYAAVGLHPIHVEDFIFEVEKYRELIKSADKIVAVGKTGLDYFYVTCNIKHVINLQKEVFKKHLALAREFGLPVILHCRNAPPHPNPLPQGEREINDAYDDLLEILKKEKFNNGVIHCFGGSLEQARQFVATGFYIGITGIVTFGKKAEALQNIVRELPLEKILIETDCPYLAPEPHRGERNMPQYVEFVGRKVAELKDVSFEEVREQTAKNAKKLFKL